MAIPKKTTERPELPANLIYQRDKDREMVTGKFIYHEVPGGQMDFCFRAYQGDPIGKYSLKDGERVKVPLGVAKHLNNNCWYPAYDYKNDEQGRPQMSIAQRVRRCSFQSLEFVDIEGVSPVGSPINSAIPSAI